MKQDPLEQAAKKYAEMHLDVSGNLGKYLVRAVFQDGAQWQAERMYSEEEVLSILYKHTEDLLAGKKLTLEDWFNDIKKK